MQVLALAGSPEAKYYESSSPQMGIVWALLLDVLLLGIVLFLCFRLRGNVRRSVSLIGTAVITFFLLFAAIQVFRSSGDYLQKWISEKSLGYVNIAIAACGGLLLFLWPRRTLHVGEAVLLIMSPLYVIAGVDAIQVYRAVNRNALEPGSAAGALSGNQHRNRVIWIVFDELDQRYLFDSRPKRVHLDNFDALRAQSVYATEVSSPNPDTMPSLPSLILGRRVAEAKENSRDLLFKFQDCMKWEHFVGYPNVFSRARAEGFDTAISGWHHPYCRLLSGDLSECTWDVSNLPFLVAARALNQRTFIGKAAYIAEWQAQSFPLRRKFGIVTEPGGAAAIRQHSIQTYLHVSAAAEKMLSERNLNLVLIHMPIPHPPGIWDSRAARFSTGESDYIDNLQLASDFLGRVRKVLERTGQWDGSTIVVSSDHPYRVAFWQSIFFIRNDEMTRLTGLRQSKCVPFLLKMPGQHSEVPYTRPFNSVLTAALALEAVEGKVSTPADAVIWIDQHARASLNGDGGLR